MAAWHRAGAGMGGGATNRATTPQKNTKKPSLLKHGLRHATTQRLTSRKRGHPTLDTKIISLHHDKKTNTPAREVLSTWVGQSAGRMGKRCTAGGRGAENSPHRLLPFYPPSQRPPGHTDAPHPRRENAYLTRNVLGKFWKVTPRTSPPARPPAA